MNAPLTYPSKIYPLSFVVRFNPPSIGLVYKIRPSDRKKRKYEIFLNGLITLPSSDLIAKQLFLEHSLILNPEIVSFGQIQRLVEKILSNIEIIYADEEEENGGIRNNNEINDNMGENYETGEKIDGNYNYFYSQREPYINKNYIDPEENNNDLNKSFEIEKEAGRPDDEQLESFKGSGRLNFLKNLRKK